MQKLDVVYCYEGRAWEEQWWNELLSDFAVQLHRGPGFSLVIPDALYVVDGSYGLNHVPRSFLDQVERAGQCGVLHIGDEFARGPYSVYAAFAYVLRQEYKSFLKSPGLLNTPLGYTNDASPTSIRPASERKYLWAFTGADNATRRKLAAIWAGLEPSYLHLVDLRAGEKHQSRQQFLDLMRDAVFAPCPMGNVHIEVGRTYEALENGAIPLVTMRRGFAYWEAVLGDDHPLPGFYNWADARAFVADIGQRPADMDALQHKIHSWWTAKKAEVRKSVKAHVEAGRRGEFRDAVRRDFSRKGGLTLQVPRLYEAVRHHDVDALVGRGRIFYGRLTGKIAWANRTPGKLSGS